MPNPVTLTELRALREKATKEIDATKALHAEIDFRTALVMANSAGEVKNILEKVPLL